MQLPQIGWTWGKGSLVIGRSHWSISDGEFNLIALDFAPPTHVTAITRAVAGYLTTSGGRAPRGDPSGGREARQGLNIGRTGVHSPWSLWRASVKRAKGEGLEVEGDLGMANCGERISEAALGQ